jgi:pimeloyl-ACP methyl ester carboxylesterase
MPTTHEPGGHTRPLRERRVASAGIGLAVREYGKGPVQVDRPHVVLVHGYPDNQEMWGPVARRLVSGGMHVVTYDVRGAGASDVPERKRDYRAERLVDDLVAVLDATVPDGKPAHLVGHDWGSVALWEAVLGETEDPRLRGRIASFTSVSGPAMDQMTHLMRNPRGRTRGLLRQLGRSWYILAFQVPLLPELVWRVAHRAIGARAARLDSGAAHGYWGPELARDAANGLNLYRANVQRRNRWSHPRRTAVPVLVVAPRRDPFLTDVATEDLDTFCSDVTLVRPDTGHWVPRSHPDLLADLVAGHVAAQR